ncbi:hypothetical protein KCU81_g172, partial [Aureobasidium melanogenum]
MPQYERRSRRWRASIERYRDKTQTQLEVRVGRFLAPTQLEYHDRAVALSALFPLPDRMSLPRAQKSLLNVRALSAARVLACRGFRRAYVVIRKIEVVAFGAEQSAKVSINERKARPPSAVGEHQNYLRSCVRSNYKGFVSLVVYILTHILRNPSQSIQRYGGYQFEFDRLHTVRAVPVDQLVQGSVFPSANWIFTKP